MHGFFGNDHTMLTAPVLVWSLKLSSIGRGQYLDGVTAWEHRVLLAIFLIFFN